MKRCRSYGSGHGWGSGSMGLKRRSFGARVWVKGRSSRLWKASSLAETDRFTVWVLAGYRLLQREIRKNVFLKLKILGVRL
jgi:hypothetical protein